MNVYIPGTGLATQGPCPAGFHVPTYSEFDALMTKTTTVGGGTGTNIMTYLKLPAAGNRVINNGNTSQQGSNGYYYCSDKYYYIVSTAGVGSGSISYTTYGYSIRPFKDISVVPDSNWTVLKQGTGTAGIYHNSTLGLISISSDGENRQTIADKNLGATTVYNYGDTLSQNNCGNYYQRGNCYGFPRTGSITTSGTQVNAGSYGPSNPYSSSTYITRSASPYDWDSSNNANLRGGEDGNVTVMSELKNAYIGKLFPNQGPCDSGFHIPTSTEFGALKTAGVTLGAWTSNGGDNAKTYLKLPFAGDRNYKTASVESVNSQGYYRCCDGSGSSVVTGYGYMIFSNYFDLSSLRPGYGASIRPFKDTPVVPDSNWTTLYAGTGDAGIYHDSTNGLISISADGTNWITIADKNLGATEVYNTGNVSGLNRGNYYQWGNNYAFSYAGTPTTSSTQVNTTGYGPGNYYTSSTFVLNTNGYWFSDLNKNLRGGEDA